MRTKAVQKMYMELDKCCAHTTSTFLHDFAQLTKHHDVDEEKMKEFKLDCLAHIGDFSGKLDGGINAAMDASVTQKGEGAHKARGGRAVN